jgi:hypothetical protein
VAATARNDSPASRPALPLCVIGNSCSRSPA